MSIDIHSASSILRPGEPRQQTQQQKTVRDGQDFLVSLLDRLDQKKEGAPAAPARPSGLAQPSMMDMLRVSIRKQLVLPSGESSSPSAAPAAAPQPEEQAVGLARTDAALASRPRDQAEQSLPGLDALFHNAISAAVGSAYPSPSPRAAEAAGDNAVAVLQETVSSGLRQAEIRAPIDRSQVLDTDAAATRRSDLDLAYGISPQKPGQTRHAKTSAQDVHRLSLNESVAHQPERRTSLDAVISQDTTAHHNQELNLSYSIRKPINSEAKTLSPATGAIDQLHREAIERSLHTTGSTPSFDAEAALALRIKNYQAAPYEVRMPVEKPQSKPPRQEGQAGASPSAAKDIRYSIDTTV